MDPFLVDLVEVYIKEKDLAVARTERKYTGVILTVKGRRPFV
jgi:hypothetical protein